MVKSGNHSRLPAYISSIVFLLLLWIICSKLIAAPLILPSPLVVVKEIIILVPTKIFWKSFAFSFVRVICAFVISVVSGSLCGYFCARNISFRYFMELPLAIISATPVIAVILIALFWFTSDWVPVFAAFLMSFPVMTNSVSAGFSEKDKKLVLMAESFCFSNYQYFKYIQLPVCRPFFYSGAETAFGMCWKVVAASEVLCLPDYAFGKLMQKSQVHLETQGVMAVTVMLVIVSFVMQKFLAFFAKRGTSNG